MKINEQLALCHQELKSIEQEYFKKRDSILEQINRIKSLCKHENTHWFSAPYLGGFVCDDCGEDL